MHLVVKKWAAISLLMTASSLVMADGKVINLCVDNNDWLCCTNYGLGISCPYPIMG